MKEKLRKAFLDQGIKYFQGIQKNGKICNWIIDSREIILDKDKIDIIAKEFTEILKKYPEVTHIGGLEITAVPIISAIVMHSGLKGFIVRKERKRYGLQKIIEGNSPLGKKSIIIDDLINSGGSIKKAIKHTEDEGGEVSAVFSIINFDNEGNAYLKENNIPHEYIFTLEDLYLINKESIDVGERIISPKILWKIDNVNTWKELVQRSNPLLYKKKVYFGSNEGIFYCIDPSDGSIIWKRNFPIKMPKRILSSPAGADEKIIFGDYSGMLRVLNHETGKTIWQARRGEWIGSSPKIWNNNIFIGIEYGQRNGISLCSDLKSGKVIWHQKTKDYVHSTPEICTKERLVVIGCNDGYVYINNAETGALYDKIYLGKETKASFCYESPYIFFGAFDGNAYCYDLEKKEIIWKRNLARIIYSTPIIYQDSVIIPTVENKLFSLNKRTGSVNWIFNTYGMMFSDAIVNKGLIFCGSTDGSLYSIDPKAGILVKKYLINREILTRPLFVDDIIILSCKGTTLAIKS
jgi:eukaryotic-like serine/threonine-protein kinase